MFAALLLASLVAAPDIVTTGVMQSGGPVAHGREVFRVGLSQSGLSTTMPAGVPTPTFVWLATAPTVNSVATSETLTLTGAVEQYGAPFCESGLFTRVADQDGSCMVAKNFDANDYYTAAGGYADIASASLSICAMASPDDSASVKILASQQDGVSNNGWSLRFSNTETCDFYVQTTGGNATGSASPAPLSQWSICCGSAGATNGIKAYLNGAAGSAAAYPAGTATTTSPMIVGASASLTNKFDGRIAGIWIWEGSELTATQFASFAQRAMGVLGSRGEAATFTNTGPVYAWLDGQIHAFSDNYPIIGAEIPPGMTGAGSPATGYLANPTQTVSNLSSRDLSTNWTAVGAAVVACSQTTTPFADARTTCKVTDNDAASVEYIHQSLDVTALAGGAKIQVCVYAAADSAQTLDLQVAESGVCAGSTIDFAAASVTTSWQVFPFTHTLADGTCTTANYRLSPGNFGTNADQGHGYYLVQIYKSQDYCPPIYCETTSAAVSCGLDSLAYSPPASSFVGPYRLSANYTPGNATASSGYYTFLRNAGSTEYALLYGAPATSTKFYSLPGGADYITDATPWTTGTSYFVELLMNYDRDNYQMKIDGASVGTSTSALTSPSSVTTLCVGAGCSTGHHVGGLWTRDYRIHR